MHNTVVIKGNKSGLTVFLDPAPPFEQLLSDVAEKFRESARFTEGRPELTEEEYVSLAWGARTMTLECGLRFLTDYLDGDNYFAVHRPGQNLDRCRTQLKMVQDMEGKWDKMLKIIGDLRQ